MNPRPRVGVLGANSLVGETLLELLVERRFPAVEIRVFALGTTPGAQVSAGGEDWDIEELGAADLSAFDLLFAAPQTGLSPSALRALASGKTVLIDAGQALGNEPGPVSVVPEANSEVLADAPSLIASPAALSVALATLLKPLQTRYGLSRVQVSSYQAVSELGREAVEELAQQTRQLLTFQPVSTRVFSRQIAFNCLPLIGELDDQGQSSEERRVTGELRALLGEPTLAIAFTAVRVPVFYGHGASVSVETTQPFDLIEVEALLAAAPGLSLVNDASRDYYPTAVTEASGEDAVCIGRLRRDPSHARSLQLWLVADNLRKGSALNAVQIAEALLAT